MIDLKRECGTLFQRAFFDRADMGEHVAGIFLRIGDLKAHAVRLQDSGIADLAAGFAIERCLIEHDGATLALFQRGNFLTVAHQRGHHASGLLGVVAEKFRCAELFA